MSSGDGSQSSEGTQPVTSGEHIKILSWYDLQTNGMVPQVSTVPEEGWQWDDGGKHLLYSDGHDIVTVHSPDESNRLAAKYYAMGYDLPKRPTPRDGSHRAQPADNAQPIPILRPETPAQDTSSDDYKIGHVYKNSHGLPFILGANGQWIPVNHQQTPQVSQASQAPQATPPLRRTWGEAWQVLRNDPSVSRFSYRVAVMMFAALGVNVADEGVPVLGQLDDILAPGELALGALATAITIVRVNRLRNPNN